MESIDKEGLDDVEKVNDLVLKLATSNDPSVLEESEKYLASKEKIKNINKTVINPNNETKENGEVNQEMFLEQIKKDAMERSERIRIAKEKADKIKCKANDYFKVCDFEKSIQLYTKAICLCKSYDILYTNRAQAYLKIKKFTEVLNDCDSAIFLNSQNHKAFNLKAKALIQLDQIDEAIMNYNKVIELKPNFQKCISESIKEAELLKKNQLLLNNIKINKNHSSEFKNCQISDVVKFLINENQIIRYYIGGLQFLDSNLRDDQHSTNILYQDFLNNAGLFGSDSQVSIQLEKVISSLTAYYHSSAKSPGEENAESIDLLGIWMSLVVTLVQSNLPTQSEDKRGVECVQIYQNKFFQNIIQFLCPSAHSNLPNYPYSHYPKSTTQSVLDPIGYQALQLLYNLVKSIDTIPMKLMWDCHPPYLVNMVWSIVFYNNGAGETLGLLFFDNIVNLTEFETYIRENDSRVNNLLINIHKEFTDSIVKAPMTNLITIISIIKKLCKLQIIRRAIFHQGDLIDCSISAIESRIGLMHDEKHTGLMVILVEFLYHLFISHQTTINAQSILADGIRIMIVRIANLSHQLLAIKYGTPEKTKQMRTSLIVLLSISLHHLTDEQLIKWCERTPPQEDPSSNEYSDTVTSDSLVRSLSQKPLESPSETRFFSQVSGTLQLALAIVLEAPTHPLLSPALKLLTLATKVSHPTRCLCCDKRSRVLKLAKLISKTNDTFNEPVVGNVCLLLSQCIEETPVSEHLADYVEGTRNNIIMRLLCVCQDARNALCRKNAAILVGKLGSTSHKHRAEISNLDGFNIIRKYAPRN